MNGAERLYSLNEICGTLGEEGGDTPKFTADQVFGLAAAVGDKLSEDYYAFSKDYPIARGRGGVLGSGDYKIRGHRLDRRQQTFRRLVNLLPDDFLKDVT